MAAGRLIVPGWMPAVDADGVPIPNAKMFIYLNKTTTLATIYSDMALTLPLPNPVLANAAGQWPAMWADDADLFSVSIDAPYGPPGVPFTYDDLGPSTAANTSTAGKADKDGGNVSGSDSNSFRGTLGAGVATSIAAATQLLVSPTVNVITTDAFQPDPLAPKTLEGGATYRESSVEEVANYPAQAWFTSNGGSRYWLLAETEVMPEMFGARGDWDGTTGTDDTQAMQAFFDFMEVARCAGRLRQRRYRLTGTIYGGRKGGFRLTGVAKTFPADNQWASTLIFDVPNGTNGLFLANEVATARRDGIEIDGLQIYRVAKEPLGGGGVGITYKGLVQGLFKNITVHRFDINGYITEATGGGTTSGCVFDTIRYEGGATAGCVVDACIESDFRHGKFGHGKYGLWARRAPSGYTWNGNYFSEITFISDGPAPNGCDHNFFDDNSRGYANFFSEVVFEGATLQNMRCVGSAEVSRMAATFDNVSFNAGIGGTLWMEDYNFFIGGGSRIHSNSATSPCVTLKRTTASANALVGIISDSYVTYLTECGVKIDGWNGATVTGNVCQDRSGAFNLPFVKITSTNGGDRNIVANNRLRTGHQPGYVDESIPQTNIFHGNNPTNGVPVSLGPDVRGAPSRTLDGATPVRQLFGVNGNSASDLVVRGSANTGAPRRISLKSRSVDPTAKAAVQDGDDLHLMEFYGDDGSAEVRSGYVRSFVKGTVSTGVVPSALEFGTRSSEGLAGRLYIVPNGFIGVATADPVVRMDVRGELASIPGNTEPAVNGQMVMQTTASGIRFKWKDPATGNVRLTAYLPWT